MVIPWPVRLYVEIIQDQALASGFSHHTGGQTMVLLFYTTYISVDLAHYETFCAKVNMGGIKRLFVICASRLTVDV